MTGKNSHIFLIRKAGIFTYLSALYGKKLYIEILVIIFLYLSPSKIYVLRYFIRRINSINLQYYKDYENVIQMVTINIIQNLTRLHHTYIIIISITFERCKTNIIEKL